MLNLNILRQKYTAFSRPYQLKLPLEIGKIIPDDDCVRLLDQIVEELDLTDLYSTYSKISEKQASPRQMLKIMLYAYHENIFSSRGIERACRRDINFMYLLDGKPVPDHSTVARFRTLHFAPHAEKYLSLFTEMLRDLGEISGETIFIDGTKIEANANRYTFVWKKSVTKNQQKLMDKAADLAQECVESYGLKVPYGNKVTLKSLQKILKKLNKICKDEGIEFVHGTGKRKTPLQRHIEQLNETIERLERYSKQLHTLGERNSYSKTDEDATFMRMKEDHMRNGQLKPAYNLQLGVDSGYAVWLTVSERPTDTWTLKPFLSSAMESLNFSYSKIVADAGYESEENYCFLEDHQMTAMIKPANYEISKTRKFKADISREQNMEYDPEKDCYICRNGKILERERTTQRKTSSGFIRMMSHYVCNECKGCPYRNECLKGRNWKIPEPERKKRLEVSRRFVRQRSECLKRLTTPEGIQLRVNRSIQAEGAFAMLKEDRGFRRYLCRGKRNVYAESVLLAISQNIGTLHHKIQNGKTGTHLHPVTEQ